MALQFVGQTSGQGTGATYTISLSGTLTGGIASSPSTGDIVLVINGFASSGQGTPTVSGNNSGTYTSIHTALFGNDTYDSNLGSFYFIQGSTVDTQLTIGRTSSTAYGGVAIVQVWRGVDTTTPLDVTATTATGINGSRPNPPAITPTTAGSIIFAGGTGGQNTGSGTSVFVIPSNMTAGLSVLSTAGTTIQQGTFLAYYDAWTSGFFDPNAATGGSTGAQNAWASATFALRPAATTITGTLSTSETGSDTFSSSGKVTVKGSLAVSETGSDAFDSQGSLTSALVGDLHATESGSDSFTSSGKVTVKGSLAATESADTFNSSGKVLVSGSASLSESGADAFDCQGSVLANDTVGDLHGYESGSDSFTSSGGVVISGAMFVSETGSDSFLASGDISVTGSLDASESGADAFEADGYIVQFAQGDLDASESGSDAASLSGELDTVFTLTGTQALLLRKIHALHGLSSPLVVSSTSRVAGDVVQTVAEAGGVVTIETTGGNDTFSGTVGQLIEELAALHGITDILEVTETSRSVGSITQSISVSGGVTTVTRQ